ncbi:hypothetical protein C8D76_103221 [Pasteurella langaaensis DSM 22999]|uniref:UPF0231 protein C8D76_103221 n=1 Tax=Alitibacter langaaensis DSM 22999 TaxID=1122935 RepID=A0A2U0TAJ9_9PAST|nr:YacL family protein [Pasteurella langaaensis]PVX40645.1 hypothetical protein C8D76_103221 [Pasteurella langaaensis DSM 22999]
MDFQFSAFQGNVIAKCSMEHIAVANWLNTELPLNPALISTALDALEQAKQFNLGQEIRLVGKEYSLFIDGDEVLVRANNLAFSQDDELEQDFHYYDEESIAFCGLEDFEQFLKSYLNFIHNR